MVKEYYKKIKELGVSKLLLILLAGILLVYSYSGESNDKQDDRGNVKDLRQATGSSNTAGKNTFSGNQTITNDELADSIQDILLKMAGVSEAGVLITYADSGRQSLISAKTYENDSLSEQDAGGGVRRESRISESEEYLYIGEEPFIIMQTNPTIRGVVVVYKGSADAKDITEAVKVLTGVDYNRIKVSLMN